MRQSVRQPTIECRLCSGNHFVRECLRLVEAKRLLGKGSTSESDSKSTSARTSASSDSSSVFKKDGTAILYDTEESPVQIIDPSLLMRKESTPGTPQMQLFFVFGAVQSLPTWILAGSGSVGNLVNQAVYRKLPYQPPIRNPGECRVIGGNGEPLDLKGFTVLPVTLGTILLWHEFGVVPNLPLEVLTGADILSNHQCSLLYQKNNQKSLLFGNENWQHCDRFRTHADVGASIQQKFVNRILPHCRNRFKIGANFVATLPENDEREQKKNEYELELNGLQPETVQVDLREEQCEPQAGKLQNVFADLRVATLPIPEQVRKRLVEVVKENLNAFAASPTDLGRTSVVVHTIKTGNAKPFRQKLRPVPFAIRHYLEQEVEKLLAIGAVSEADPGACPYASRTVTTPKKDGTIRLCVDYRDINAQTEKDSYPLPRINQVWPTL